MFNVGVNISYDENINFELLETITDQARMTDKEFLGMGVSNGRLVLTYSEKPRNVVELKKTIHAILNSK